MLRSSLSEAAFRHKTNRDRKALLAQKPADANDVLLMDAATGDIYEGTSSNFFAVVRADDSDAVAVHSAPEGAVLLGTVMRMVLQVCDERAIQVVRRFPNLKDLKDGRWVAAFITSAPTLHRPLVADPISWMALFCPTRHLAIGVAGGEHHCPVRP